MKRLIALVAVGLGGLALIGCAGDSESEQGAVVGEFLADRGTTTVEFCVAWHEAEDKYGGFVGAAASLEFPGVWESMEAEGGDVPFEPSDVTAYAARECGLKS